MTAIVDFCLCCIMICLVLGVLSQFEKLCQNRNDSYHNVVTLAVEVLLAIIVRWVVLW